MLPSVDSRLAWRVILLRISTARPVSVLLWIVLRNFLPPASGRTFRTTKTGKERERDTQDDARLVECSESASQIIAEPRDSTGQPRRGEGNNSKAFKSFITTARSTEADSVH